MDRCTHRDTLRLGVECRFRWRFPTWNHARARGYFERKSEKRNGEHTGVKESFVVEDRVSDFLAGGIVVFDARIEARLKPEFRLLDFCSERD